MADVTYRYKPTFRTAQGVGSFISFVGWLGIGGAGVVILMTLGNMWGSFGLDDLMGLMSGFGLVMGGILTVAAGQLTRTTAASADSDAETLAMMQRLHQAENSYKEIRV